MKKYVDSPYKYHLIGILAICLLCIIIYSNTLNSPFVFDDFRNISENPYILRSTGLDFQKLYDAAFKSTCSNRPAANITFALNYYFGRLNVTGYHIVNILIHIINGILVYFLALITFRQLSNIPDTKITQPEKSPIPARRRTRPDKADGFKQTGQVSIPLMSLFAALIFVAHPIQTQSVTYIVQRMASMAVMFYLLSLFLYINGRLAQINWKRWALFSGCFVSWMMALGSKEIAATLPFIILLYEWYFFQDMSVAWLKRNLKYFLGLIVLLGLLAFIYLGGNPIDRILAGCTGRDFTIWERVLTQFRVVVFYISLLFYFHPARLNLLHHITTSHSLLDPITTLLSLLIIVGLIGLAIYLARKRRLISFCILWFFINLAIESSVIGLEMVYEHRLYLPMFGFALLVSYLLFHFLSKRQLWAIIISVFIVISLGTATYLRNGIWQDEITLWSDVISKHPKSIRAHNNLGNALGKHGRHEEAISHFSEALRLEPDDARTYYNIGVALAQQKRLKEAISYFSEALRLKPNDAQAHNNLGVVLKRQGHVKEAIDHFSEALRIYPDHAGAHYNLGIVLVQQKRFKEAIRHFSEALRFNPDHAGAHNNLGAALKRQGHLKEAIGHFSEAVRINPDHAGAHNNLGFTLAQQGRLKEAINHFSEVVRLKPDDVEARNDLGIALAQQGRLKEAISYFSEALRLKPDDTKSHYNLGVALAQQGRLKEAINHFSEVVRLRPDNAGAHYNLGNALARQGNIKEATNHFSRVVKLKPGNAKAHFNLGFALAQQERLKEAIGHYYEALRLKPDFSFTVHYNIACIYARQNKIEESIDWLKKAIKKGFKDWNLIKTDKDLENIRGTSYYKEIIARIRK